MRDENAPPQYPRFNSPEHIRHVVCPNCGFDKAVVAADHFSEWMCFCPSCEHVWDCPTNHD